MLKPGPALEIVKDENYSKSKDHLTNLDSNIEEEESRNQLSLRQTNFAEYCGKTKPVK